MSYGLPEVAALVSQHKTHLVTRHVTDYQVPWVCVSCSQRYVKERQLARHISQKHHEGATQRKGGGERGRTLPMGNIDEEDDQEQIRERFMKTLAGPAETTTIVILEPEIVMMPAPEIVVTPEPEIARATEPEHSHGNELVQSALVACEPYDVVEVVTLQSRVAAQDK